MPVGGECGGPAAALISAKEPLESIIHVDGKIPSGLSEHHLSPWPENGNPDPSKES